ncbi:MAG: fatty acid desaturase [Gemmatimonadota bacterium]
MLRFRADLKTLVWMGATTALLLVQWRGDGHNWALYGVYLYLSISVAVTAHNHNHVRMWKSKALNHLTDLWITLFYGFPIFGWIPTHNANHHKHNNRDPDHTKTWRFWEANNLFTLAIYPAVSAYYQQRAIARYFGELWSRNRGRFYAALSQVVVLVFWVVGALLLDWRKALVYVLIPQQVSLTTVLIFNYLQHVHANEEDDWNHSRNFTGPVLNFLLFNNGFHTVHHQTPGLHWSQTTAEHGRIQHNIRPSLNVSSAPWYMVRTFVLAPFVRGYRTRGMRVEREEAMKS